jgi:high-affinity iron transporter
MLAALLIVFREVIEAGLIIGIVLAATVGLPKRGLWIFYGIVGGLIGSCIIARFTGEIASFFEGSGQELFNASILLLAVGMLTWHNVWMASHGRELATRTKKIGAAVSEGQEPITALAFVCGLAVLREGSEVVLFLYGVSTSGGTSSFGILIGGLLGLLGGAGVSLFIYLGMLKIPVRYFFSVTSGLITVLAAGLAAQAIANLQQAGYVEVLTLPVWDTSWLLPETSFVGSLFHTLVGYMDRPNGAQLVAYILTVTTICALMLGVGVRSRAD